MRTLIAKELRALQPLAGIIVGFIALILASIFVMEFPDEQPLDPQKWLSSDRDGALVFILFFSLLAGAGLLVSESDNGTLHFLDGLPLSRTRIFIAKIVAAVVVLFILPVIGLSFDSILGLASRTSLDPPFPWSFIAAELLLQLAAIIYALAVTVAISFLRQWFALVAGLLFWLFLYLREQGPSWIKLLDPHAVLEVGLVDGVQMPWRHLAAQMGAASVLFVLAWLGFCAMGDRTQLAADRISRNRFLRFCGNSLRLLAPVVWIYAFAQLGGNALDPDEALKAHPLGESGFGRRETKAYEFLFRESDRADADALINSADKIHQKVREFFAAPEPSSRIVVDLASPVIPHAAGQTNWTRIRLPLFLSDDESERERILAHETAHVYIEQLSDGRFGNQFRYVRFLHEGVATYVEDKYFGEEDGGAKLERTVAAAWARGAVAFSLLSDDDKLSKTRDQYLAYPLGKIFVSALVEVYGHESVAKLLRSFGRKNVPFGLDGVAWWRDTMQAAGMNLDRVAAAYESKCAELTKAQADFVSKLPRITSTVVVEGENIVIRPSFEGETLGKLTCIVETAGSLNENTVLPRDDDGTFRLRRSQHPGLTLKYMLGWSADELRFPVFEPWAHSPL